MPSHDYREIAKAYLKEAKVDLRAAQLLREGREFSRAVAMCQQAVEKTLKAALALKGIIVLEHMVAEQLVASFPELENARELGKLAKSLEREGTRTRYPLFGRVDLPIWVPSEMYTEKDADDALDKARYILEQIESLMETEYNIKL